MKFTIFVITFVVLMMTTPALSQQSPSPITVMTFNIRYDNPQDGPNAWPHRREMVAEEILTRQVDIVGMQEVLEHQGNYLAERLSGYASYGVGRDDGKKRGEFTSIYFRKPRFDLLDQSTFWLSETPHRAGSRGWDASLSRIVSWVKLHDRLRKRDLFFFNTHFSHVGQQARKNSALLLVRKIGEIAGDAPVILAGDFNCRSDSEPYQILTENWKGIPQLFDAHFVSQTGHFGGQQTINGFRDGASGSIIDYLFCNSHWKVIRQEILVIRQGDVFISDHYPVLATMELLNNPPDADKSSAKSLPK